MPDCSSTTAAPELKRRLRPRIVLAPMEGVIDAPMRARLTGLGGFDRCVTEFVRVTTVLLPERVFLRLCPELLQGGCTRSGVPVFIQLLGSDADALARNARRAVDLGAPGVDLNFGCPAKTVNNSMGGSILLREPERIAAIVAAVREAVPASIPVTAKIRLGYENRDRFETVVQGIRLAGATELAVHARTRSDGYRPPAWWSSVKCVMHSHRDATFINGEIWTVADSHAALQASGCGHLMLGRGALAAPDLARRIRASLDGIRPRGEPMLDWWALLDEVEDQFKQADASSPRHVGNRTKQWLAYLKRSYPEADQLFQRMRTLHDRPAILQAFADHRKLDTRLRCLPGNPPTGRPSP